MRELFNYANQYVKQSNWKDLVLIKFCLCSIGIMIGLCIPKEKRKLPLTMAATIFIATYIPLMTKFLKVIIAGNQE